MTQTRFICTLTRVDEPACASYARETIVDSEGTTARGCPRHAVAALDGTSRACVDWSDSRASTSGSAQPWSWPKNEASSASAASGNVRPGDDLAQARNGDVSGPEQQAAWAGSSFTKIRVLAVLMRRGAATILCRGSRG
jgi:hypothetical protein